MITIAIKEAILVGIYTSTDSGATWAERVGITEGEHDWTSAASSADGTKLVVNFMIMTKTNISVVASIPHPILALLGRGR